MVLAATSRGGAIINRKLLFHTLIVPLSFYNKHKTYTARLFYLIWWTCNPAESLTISIGIILPETLPRWAKSKPGKDAAFFMEITK
jgi:hypothetical protein